AVWLLRDSAVACARTAHPLLGQVLAPGHHAQDGDRDRLLVVRSRQGCAAGTSARRTTAVQWPQGARNTGARNCSGRDCWRWAGRVFRVSPGLAPHGQSMTAYIIRRLLLMIPTLFGIMLINFIVVQAAPGGPVEQAIAQLTGAGAPVTERITRSGTGEQITPSPSGQVRTEGGTS